MNINCLQYNLSYSILLIFSSDSRSIWKKKLIRRIFGRILMNVVKHRWRKKISTPKICWTHHIQLLTSIHKHLQSVSAYHKRSITCTQQQYENVRRTQIDNASIARWWMIKLCFLAYIRVPSQKAKLSNEKKKESRLCWLIIFELN